MKDPAVAHSMNATWENMQHEPTNELFPGHRLGRADVSFVVLVLDRHIAILIDQDPIV